MKAFVHCSPLNWSLSSFKYSGNLIEFLNRPFIHHVIESLAERGFEQIDFLCKNSAMPFMNALGRGERWGMEFNFVADTNLAFAGLHPDETQTFSGFALPFSAQDVERIVRIDSPDDFLSSQKIALSKLTESMLIFETIRDSSIWVGRNVSIHPTVQLQGPVLIGDHCRIGKGVVLGPNTVIGRNCMIDDNTYIENSCVFANAFVGEGLFIRDAILSERDILNTKLDVEISVNDSLILSRFP